MPNLKTRLRLLVLLVLSMSVALIARAVDLEIPSKWHLRLPLAEKLLPNPQAGEHSLSAKTEGGVVLQVKELIATDAKSADKFVDDQVAQIESIFQPLIEPYTGRRVQKCEAKYQPKKIEKNLKSGVLVGLELYANDRFSFGDCNSTGEAYRTSVVLLNCKLRHEVFVIQRFFPKGPNNDAQIKASFDVDCT